MGSEMCIRDRGYSARRSRGGTSCTAGSSGRTTGGGSPRAGPYPGTSGCWGGSGVPTDSASGYRLTVARPRARDAPPNAPYCPEAAVVAWRRSCHGQHKGELCTNPGAPAGAPAAREIRGIRRLAGWFAWGREDRVARMTRWLRTHMSWGRDAEARGKRALCMLEDMESVTRVDPGHYSVKSQSQPSLCLLYTSPSPRDGLLSRMPSSA